MDWDVVVVDFVLVECCELGPAGPSGRPDGGAEGGGGGLPLGWATR